VKKKPKEKPTRVVVERRRTASLTKTANELNLQKRHVQVLAREGMPKANGKGIYYIDECLRWYVRYLQHKLRHRGNPKGEDEPASPAATAKHQILSVDLALKEIELAAKREELIPIEVVQRDVAGLVMEVRTRILSLPPRLAAEVLGETDLAVSQVKIDKSLKRALEALSKYEPGAK
jgi:phage terminase Nu1 subunit (DNA packaging protein)